MQTIFLILFIGLIGFDFSSGKHPIFGKNADIITAPDLVECFQISESPVLSNEQVAGKLYHSDYEVLRKIELSDTAEIQEALLDAANYSDSKRMCPFQGKFLLRFVKKKKFIHVVISADNCKKCIVFSSEKAINKTYHDFKEESKIFNFLQF
jgi:hypothetical protein